MTPVVPNGGRNVSEEVVLAKGSTADGKRTVDLGSQVRHWPTPDANVMNDGEAPESFEARRQKNIAKGYNGNGMGTPLAMAAQMWPTTTTQDAESVGRHSTSTGVMHPGTTLTDAIRAWATPKATSDTGASSHGDGGADIQTQVQRWATPNARDHKGCDLPSRNGGTSLAEQTQTGRFSHRDQPIPDGPQLSPPAPTLPLRLNPVFGCWLMGWPTWWTNPGPTVFAQSEMALWRSRLRSLCDTYCAPLECCEMAAA